MGPGRSRGPWEWECRQPGGAACEAERRCSRSSVGDNASKLGVKLSWKSTSPETHRLRSSTLSSAPLGAGSTEGVGTSMSTGACQACHLLTLPFTAQEVAQVSTCVIVKAIPASME